MGIVERTFKNRNKSISKFNPTIFILLFMVLFLGFGLNLSARQIQLIKGPYLIYPGTNSKMTVLWQLNGTLSGQIQWGKTLNYELGTATTTETGAGDYEHQHIYTITSLSANTLYYYRINVEGTYYTGDFRSAPSPFETKIKFYAFGDTRTYPQSVNMVTGRIIDEFKADPQSQTFLIHAGDWNNSDAETDWQNDIFNRLYSNNLYTHAHLPLMGARGNHEGEAIQFKKYWPYPYQTGGCYYSYDYGPVHVAMVDLYVDYSTGSTQLQWLQNDLSTSTKAWKIVVLHEPGYSGQGNHPNNVNVQTYIQPLCEQYGVPLVISAHNHYYAHCLVNNVHHLTLAGGGAETYNFDANSPYLIKADRSYHFAKLEIHDNCLFVQIIRPNGGIIETFQIENSTVPLNAEYSYTPNSLTVSFSDQSISPDALINSWFWNFGDGSFSTEANPTHTFANAGFYAVSLTVNNEDGLGDTKTQALRLRKNSIEDFLGTFTGLGVWLQEGDTKVWKKLIGTDAVQLAAGDFDGDGWDDCLGWYGDAGVWIRYATGTWSSQIVKADNLKYITCGDMNGDKKADLLGSWTSGVWWRDTATGSWSRLYTAAATKLTALDLDTDGKDDLIGVWPDLAPEVWARYSATAKWQRLIKDSPTGLAIGDMNGDGFLDYLGNFSCGIWYFSTAIGDWFCLYSTSALIIATGDLNQGGSEDLIGVWDGSPGVWVRYSETGVWQKINTLNPTTITSGKLHILARR